jgi:ribosomal protein S18 acetylase RimI-like enzyme
MLTEVKHLVVHPLFRKMGLGRALIETAMKKADTPIMYATIRESNSSSLYIFKEAGFKIISTAEIKDHKTHFLIKENETYNQDAVAGEIKPTTGPGRRNPIGIPDSAWK